MYLLEFCELPRVSQGILKNKTARYPEIPVSQGISGYLLEKKLEIPVSQGIPGYRDKPKFQDTLRYLEVPPGYFHTRLYILIDRFLFSKIKVLRH